MTAWLYTFAFVLGAAWLATFAWSLLSDRSRGRSRCPKCFYDLTPPEGDAARPDACPECGKRLSERSRLSKTRRRWATAALATVILLPPAILTAGFARVQQSGGWADLPAWITTRLLWTGNDAVVADTERRMMSLELDDASFGRMALYAIKLLESGDKVDIDAGVATLANMAWVAQRPVSPRLSDHHAIRAVDALLPILSHPKHVQHSAAIVQHYAQVDDRALIELLDLIASGTPGLRLHLNYTILYTEQHPPRRPLPPLPPGLAKHQYPPRANPALNAIVDALRTQRQSGRPLTDWAQRVLSSERAGTGVTQNVSEFESIEIGATDDGFLRQALAAWLVVREDPNSDRAWSVIQALIKPTERHPSSDERSYGVSLLSAADWSPRVRDLLSQLIDPAFSDVRTETLETLRDFGAAASEFEPDLVAMAPKIAVAEGAIFPHAYASIGGDPESLVDSVCERLSTVREPPAGNDFVVEPAIEWVSTLDIRHPRVAERLAPWLNTAHDRTACRAAVAFALSGGDPELATRTVLERTSPPLASGWHVWQVALYELMQRDLAAPDLVLDYLARLEPPIQYDLLTAIGWLEPERARRYLPGIHELCDSNDSVVASTATVLVNRID